MSKALRTNSRGLGRPESSASMFNKFAVIAVLAFAYVEIVQPLMVYLTTGRMTATTVANALEIVMAPRLENKIFWPALAAISLVLVAGNWSRLTLPPNIKCLFGYLAFAGASVLWAFKPELSFSRYVLQVMIVTSIVLPVLLANPATDMMRGLFLCFALACVLNVPIVLTQEPIVYQKQIIGYPGYFSFKGVLGECAAIAF